MDSGTVCLKTGHYYLQAKAPSSIPDSPARRGHQGRLAKHLLKEMKSFARRGQADWLVGSGVVGSSIAAAVPGTEARG